MINEKFTIILLTIAILALCIERNHLIMIVNFKFAQFFWFNCCFIYLFIKSACARGRGSNG